MTSDRSESRTGEQGAAAAFWFVAVAFLLVMAYSTVPTPLYPLYQELDGFPVAVVTVIFAAYAVGVVASLFRLGHVSDWLGRRRMLVVAILVSALSATLFLVFTDVAGLIVARFVNGVSVGILTATATAALGELWKRRRPDGRPVVAATVAGAANLGGLALGPLIGGLFVEFLPDPIHLSHTVFLVLMLLLAIAATAVPETVAVTARRYRPQRIAAPARGRATFLAAGFGAFAGFAVFGLFTSLAPAILTSTFGARDHLFAGAVVFVVFGSAAIGQIVLGMLSRAVQLRIAMVCCVVGLAGIAVGPLSAVLPVFVVGGVIAGVGVGVLFKSAIATASELAEPDRRGETLALMFLIAYGGLALPVLVIGVVLTAAPQTAVLVVFAVLVAVATVAAALTMLRRARG